MKYFLPFLLLIVFLIPCFAVDISSDGRIVEVKPGESAVKWITCLNTEELPRWIRVTLSNSGPIPLFNKKLLIFQENTALGWTYVQKGWVKVDPEKIGKLRVEFMPPLKTKPGQYGVWLLIEQMNTSPVVLGEDRMGMSLESRQVDSYFLPLTVEDIKN